MQQALMLQCQCTALHCTAALPAALRCTDHPAPTPCLRCCTAALPTTAPHPITHCTLTHTHTERSCHCHHTHTHTHWPWQLPLSLPSLCPCSVDTSLWIRQCCSCRGALLVPLALPHPPRSIHCLKCLTCCRCCCRAAGLPNCAALPAVLCTLPRGRQPGWEDCRL